MFIVPDQDRKIKLPEHIHVILKNRYFAKDLQETTWTDLCGRVANAVAAAEPVDENRDHWAERFYKELLFPRIFLPNTPTWINAGLPGKRTLSGCFVLPLEDTMESILECSRLFGMVQKFGGGTGVNLSNLRPKGQRIQSTHGKACGPLAVLKYLGATSQMITQGGVRQGANMAVMSVYHADVIDFINCKAEESKYLLELPLNFVQEQVNQGHWTKEKAQEFVDYCRTAGVFQLFNLSVSVDRAFMETVEEYENFKIGNPGCSNPEKSSFNKKLPCDLTIAEVWDLIVKQATASGDPGLLFLDRAQAIGELQSPLPLIGTNPCGEQFLPAYGSCNLGSIDLSKFVEGDKPNWKDHINWKKLQKVIQLSVRFLDNVVSINKHADSTIDKVNQDERRLGLGIMGWADLLLQLQVPYDSEEALLIAEEMAKFFQIHAHNASQELSKEKGVFPLFNELYVQIVPPNLTRINFPDFVDYSHQYLKKRRNAAITTIAPTGTISLIAECSSGIEPHFRAGYIHQGMKEHGGLGFIWASETIKKIAKGHNTDDPEKQLQLVNKDLKNRGWKDANTITVEWHLRHQAAWQKHIDSSISKTVNLEHSAQESDVAHAYVSAYKMGNKGCTVFRDRCKPFQVLEDPKPVETKFIQIESDKIDPPGEITVSSTIPKKVNGQRTRRPRPRKVEGVTYKVETGEGKMYLTINFDGDKMPFELFAKLGKAGTNVSGYLDAISKLASDMFRSNIHPFFVIRALRGIKTTPFGFGPAKVLSVPDAIARTLEEYLSETFGPNWGSSFGWIPIQQDEAAAAFSLNPPVILPMNSPKSETWFKLETKLCLRCQTEMIPNSGCYTCPTCGDSKCD